MEILPSILVSTLSKFQEKLRMLEKLDIDVQIDIMDGTFVPQHTFHDAAVIAKQKTTLGYELHLMVSEPEIEMARWQGIRNVKRAIVHAEIKNNIKSAIEMARDAGWEVGVALNPETPWEEIDELIPELHCVLIMSVHPGASGQHFADAAAPNHIMAKITELHRAHPTLTIAVDGGVNTETLPLLVRAGATRFAVENAIWNSPNPVSTIQELTQLANDCEM